jgi:uncharacterized protein YciI
VSRHLKTFLLALAAFLGCLIAAVLLVYAVWYVDSWDYRNSPNPTHEVRDAPVYVLLGAEMFIGLPVGLLAGVAGAAVVIWKRRRGSPAKSQPGDRTTSPDATPPPQGLPRPEDLSSHFLILLYPGPGYAGSPPKTPEDGAILMAHVGHVFQVQRPGGPALAGGPVMPLGEGGADGAPIGMIVLRGGTREEAEQLAAADPGVAAGHFRAVVVRWMVPKGQLGV